MSIINIYKNYLIIACLLFLPTFSYVALNLTSMYFGLMLCVFIIIVLSKKKIILKKNISLTIIFILFIIHFFFTSFINYENISIKYIISFISILFIYFAARLYENELIILNKEKSIKLLKSFSMILIFIGLVSIFYKFNFLNYNNYSKSVFPFSEPSHYVISSGWIILASGFYFDTKIKLLIILLLTLMGLFFPSTLLFLFIFFMIIFYFFKNIKKIIFLILFLGPLFLIISSTIDNSKYFSDRLNFSKDNSNLTSLVYLQGWDDAKRAMEQTNGLGVGFQNMGNLEPSPLNMKIYYLAGNFKNRNDGGFLASKLISEFGIIGILFIFLYIIYFIKSFVFLVLHSDDYKIHPIVITSHSIIVLFFIELFARGYGYFSPTILLVISAIYILSPNKGNANEKKYTN
jgi:hypothetical protein